MFSMQHAAVQHEHTALSEDGTFDAANDALCTLVGGKLEKEYPGRPWAVHAQIESGIVKIAVQGFQQWPYVIHVNSLKGDPSLRKVVEAGGQLLERFQMGREKFSMADWQTANQRHNWLYHRNSKAPV
jgi:hypothetical protein